MPNNVINRVKMKDIGNLPIYDESGNVDFNQLIPIPQDLDMEAGSLTRFAIDEVMLRCIDQYNTNMREILSSVVYDEIKQLHELDKESYYSRFYNDEEILNIGLQYISNIVRYGYPTWYDWCVANWSTKWNAYDTKLINEDCIQFVTAWNIPYKVYIELSKLYPYDEITVDWFNESMSFGRTSFLDGECIAEDEYRFIRDDEDDDNVRRVFSRVRKVLP